jgi:hypothetical protein
LQFVPRIQITNTALLKLNLILTFHHNTNRNKAIDSILLNICQNIIFSNLNLEMNKNPFLELPYPQSISV